MTVCGSMPGIHRQTRLAPLKGPRKAAPGPRTSVAIWNSGLPQLLECQHTHQQVQHPTEQLSPGLTSVAIWNSGLPLSPPASWPAGCEGMSPGRVIVVLLTIRPSTPCSSATAAMSAGRRVCSEGARGCTDLCPLSAPVTVLRAACPADAASTDLPS